MTRARVASLLLVTVLSPTALWAQGAGAADSRNAGSPAAQGEAPAPTRPSGNARWSWSATNELAVDHYGVSGNDALSPYRFPGNFVTDRFSIVAERESRRGPSMLLGAEFSWSDSPYLAQDGVVAQLLRFELEDGSMTLPYRVGAGDVVTDLSRRVLQTTVKGVSFEMQPRAGGLDQSILVVAGSGARTWDDAFEPEGNSVYFNGVSYLLGSPDGRAALVANFLNTRQSLRVGERDTAVAADNNIGSVYGEARLAGLLLEGEVAFLSGTSGDEAVDDGSYYAQLSRTGGAFSWRARFEDNGRNYRPIGAVGIIADRRIGEFHGRYSLGRRGNLRGRVQLIQSRYEALDPERSDLAGISYDGRFIGSRPTLQLTLSADVNSIRSQSGLLDRTFQNWAVDVRDRIAWGLRLGYRFNYRDTEDHVLGVASRTFTDHTFSVGRGSSIGSGSARWRVDVEGGFIVRRQTQVSDFDAISPLIDVSAGSRQHRVGLHLSFLDQDYVLPTVDDLSYQTRRLTYSFTHTRHVLSFEVGQELRRPSMSEMTDSLRATVRYRLSLGGVR